MRKALVLLPLLAGSPLAAQVIEWKSAADGQWNIANNWNPANIPDAANETARISVGGSYTVTLGNNPNPFVGGLELVNAAATFGIESGQNFRLEGSNLIIDGLMVLNSDQGTGNAAFTFQQDTTVQGSGKIRMLLGSVDIGDAQLVSANGVIVTLGPGIKVDGGGQIRTILVNNGTVEADIGGGMLSLDSTDKANNGVMRAVGSAELRIAPIVLTQSDSGLLEADSSGLITIKNGDIIGGTLRTANGGLVRNLSGVGLLDGVRNEGDIWIDPGSTLLVTNGLNNSGTIAINPLAETGNAEFKFSTSGELSGPGVVLLIPGSDDLNDAQFNASGASVVTIGPEQFIRGQGRMSGEYILNGRLEPGYPVGKIRSGDIAFGPTGVLQIEVTGDDTADLLEVLGEVALDGTIEIAPAYDPPVCHSWTILTCFQQSGRFAKVSAPPFNDGRVWRVAYTQDKVELRVSCYPDFSPDCSLDLFDFLEYVNQFNKQTTDADCDQNGGWDLFDFLCFVNLFNAGC